MIAPCTVDSFRVCVEFLPLPLYSGGEGWGEGVQYPSAVQAFSAWDTNPLTPGLG